MCTECPKLDAHIGKTCLFVKLQKTVHVIEFFGIFSVESGTLLHVSTCLKLIKLFFLLASDSAATSC